MAGGADRVERFCRHLLFAGFGLLCWRLLFAFFLSSRGTEAATAGAAVLAMAAMSLLRPALALTFLLAAVPLLCGLALTGLVTWLLPGLLFATLFGTWHARLLLRGEAPPRPASTAGLLAELLAGAVMLSILFSAVIHPFRAFVHHFLFCPVLPQTWDFHSIEAGFVILGGLFLFRLLETDAGSTVLRHFRGLLLAHSATILLFASLQAVFDIPERWVSLALFSPFTDIHSFGSYVVLLFACHLSLALRERNLAAGAMAVAMAWLAVLSWSRITWITGLGVLAFLCLRRLPRRRLGLALPVLVLIAFGAWSAAIHWMPGHPYVSRLQSLFDVSRYNSDQGERLQLYGQALSTMSDYPLTGSGVGTFYRRSFIRHAEHENAHNYFLQVGADLGLPALLLFLGIALLSLRAGRGAGGGGKGGEDGAAGDAAIGAAAYLVTCLTGHPLLLLPQTLLFWHVLAAAAHRHGNEAPLPRPRAAVAWAAVLLAVLACGYGFRLWSEGTRPDREYGWYDPEKLSETRMFRWTMEEARMRLEGVHAGFSLPILGQGVAAGKPGLPLSILVNGRVLQEVVVPGPGEWRVVVSLPEPRTPDMDLVIKVGRVFSPILDGAGRDCRRLGVQVGQVEYWDSPPPGGVGLQAAP